MNKNSGQELEYKDITKDVEVQKEDVIGDEEFEFDAEETEEELALKIKESPELIAIKDKINIEERDTIMAYGSEAATSVSTFADQVLKQMKLTKIEETSELMAALNDIMEEFDIEDFRPEKKNIFQKLFFNAKASIEKLFNKYSHMGTKVDKVYQQLKVYESQVNESNEVLEGMFDSNMDYYEELQKHIIAGKMVLEDVNEVKLPLLESKASESGDQIDEIAVNNLRQSAEMLSQRVYDLELAKNVALQSLPQIKMIQRGNYDLMRKINSAFIVTLPVFKQGLTQAIALKRQKIQAEAMAALDKKTNELLLKNAQNTADQSKLTAELAAGSTIQIETLQQSWEIIMNGIKETKEIQEEAIAKREEGSKILELMQKEYREETKKIR